MKRAFIALLGATLLLSATSCTLSDILGIDLAGYDMNDPWGSWEKVKPGVYVGTDKDYNEGDLIAEGYSGYIYPGYKITYTGALYNTLSIEFSVCYVTYV